MEPFSELTYPGGKVRLFLEGQFAKGTRLPLSQGQSHYLLHVMRARIGDRINLFNGSDGEWLARVAEVSRRECIVACEAKIAEQGSDDDLWLVFAPIKKTPADYLAQKATELGVSALLPVITRRTMVHRVNTDRIRANAIEAAEQSGRTTVPEIREPLELLRLLAEWPHERKLLFCDEAGGPPICEVLASQPACAWAVIIGPEGGFDSAEREMIRALPATVPASLGRRILRADTAALAALAIWQAQCGKG
ncbi:MAG TPA: 16S rRNA (uracil(1498)-N(3))-methyltransferase [Rhizomicrobium sp.]|jgi:16S rRNA (uracil1498-N3)-methyltransferase|nr:16S rRNA (uracil(1498)-N(3))-methyltransferase [Rhizomicrobium sp.]